MKRESGRGIGVKGGDRGRETELKRVSGRYEERDTDINRGREYREKEIKRQSEEEKA